MSKFDMATDDAVCLENHSQANCDKLGMNLFIKPNQVSLSYQTINNLFTNIRNMEAYGNIHGFPQNSGAHEVITNSSFTGEIPNDNNNYDTHMIKNMEWGAVAYLTMSKYGKYGNNLYSGTNKEVYMNNYYKNENDIKTFKTGHSSGEPASNFGTDSVQYNDLTISETGKGYKGAGASTSGTVYGVFDMNGGGTNLVMANMVDTSGNFFKQTWSNTIPLSKYYDLYSFNISNNSESSQKRSKLGDGMKEVQKSFGTADGRFFNDESLLFHSNKIDAIGAWISRGSDISYKGISNGIFASGQRSGNYLTSGGSRPVLTIIRDFPWKDN